MLLEDRRSQANVEVHRRPMDNRARLKQETYRNHKRIYHGAFRTEVRCPWCNEVITKSEGADLHEALVNRGTVPKELQNHIFVKENVILLHHPCHMENGQSKEMVRVCLHAICRAIGARYVGRWYKDLWDKHDMSFPRGMLVPPKAMRAYKGMQLLEYGRTLNNREFPNENEWLLNPGTQYARDFRALCVKRWQGKTIKKIHRPPTKWAGYRLMDMTRLIEDGYWFDYLSYTFGFTPLEVLNEK